MEATNPIGTSLLSEQLRSQILIEQQRASGQVVTPLPSSDVPAPAPAPYIPVTPGSYSTSLMWNGQSGGGYVYVGGQQTGSYQTASEQAPDSGLGNFKNTMMISQDIANRGITNPGQGGGGIITPGGNTGAYAGAGDSNTIWLHKGEQAPFVFGGGSVNIRYYEDALQPVELVKPFISTSAPAILSSPDKPVTPSGSGLFGANTLTDNFVTRTVGAIANPNYSQVLLTPFAVGGVGSLIEFPTVAIGDIGGIAGSAVGSAAFVLPSPLTAFDTALKTIGYTTLPEDMNKAATAANGGVPVTYNPLDSKSVLGQLGIPTDSSMGISKPLDMNPTAYNPLDSKSVFGYLNNLILGGLGVSPEVVSTPKPNLPAGVSFTGQIGTSADFKITGELPPQNTAGNPTIENALLNTGSGILNALGGTIGKSPNLETTRGFATQVTMIPGEAKTVGNVTTATDTYVITTEKSMYDVVNKDLSGVIETVLPPLSKDTMTSLQKDQSPLGIAINIGAGAYNTAVENPLDIAKNASLFVIGAAGFSLVEGAAIGLSAGTVAAPIVNTALAAAPYVFTGLYGYNVAERSTSGFTDYGGSAQQKFGGILSTEALPFFGGAMLYGYLGSGEHAATTSTKAFDLTQVASGGMFTEGVSKIDLTNVASGGLFSTTPTGEIRSNLPEQGRATAGEYADLISRQVSNTVTSFRQSEYTGEKTYRFSNEDASMALGFGGGGYTIEMPEQPRVRLQQPGDQPMVFSIGYTEAEAFSSLFEGTGRELKTPSTMANQIVMEPPEMNLKSPMEMTMYQPVVKDIPVDTGITFKGVDFIGSRTGGIGSIRPQELVIDYAGTKSIAISDTDLDIMSYSRMQSISFAGEMPRDSSRMIPLDMSMMNANTRATSKYIDNVLQPSRSSTAARSRTLPIDISTPLEIPRGVTTTRPIAKTATISDTTSIPYLPAIPKIPKILPLGLGSGGSGGGSSGSRGGGAYSFQKRFAVGEGISLGAFIGKNPLKRWGYKLK